MSIFCDKSEAKSVEESSPIKANIQFEIGLLGHDVVSLVKLILKDFGVVDSQQELKIV